MDGGYGGVGWRLKAEERLLRQTFERPDEADDDVAIVVAVVDDDDDEVFAISVSARFKVGLTRFGSGQIRLGQHQVIPGQSRLKTVNKSNQSTRLVDWSKLVNKRLGLVQFCGPVMVRVYLRVPVQFGEVWFKIVTVNCSGQTWQSRSGQHAVKQVNA
ncbi:hypothetical protein Hanom_Chr16g01503931 [Helianthus anomalus]